jgi:type I site-specific restriction endonuclease
MRSMNPFKSAKPDYSYQTSMIADVLATVRANITHTPDPSKGCVLAGGTSSGKTRMALLIIDQLLKDGVVKNVLISAHGQTILRSQMAAEAIKLRAEGLISFTFETFIESRSFHAKKNPPQVVIALPQTMTRVKNFPTLS